MDKTDSKAAVILDIDGVVNSFSNKSFYASFIYHSLHELGKVCGRKKLLTEFPKIRKMGGSNALFKFARELCGNDETFKKYTHNLTMKLDYNLISYDPSMAEFMKRLGNFGEICIRSDSLSDVAAAVWQRVMEDKSSAAIKKNMLTRSSAEEQTPYLEFYDKKVVVTGICENNMKTKAAEDNGWAEFAEKYGIDLKSSVLLDDGRKNCLVAQKLGMMAVHISKLDSLLKGSVWHMNLSDVLGRRMSSALKHLHLAVGEKVDIQKLFKVLMKLPIKKERKSGNTIALNKGIFVSRGN